MSIVICKISRLSEILIILDLLSPVLFQHWGVGCWRMLMKTVDLWDCSGFLDSISECHFVGLLFSCIDLEFTGSTAK